VCYFLRFTISTFGLGECPIRCPVSILIELYYNMLIVESCAKVNSIEFLNRTSRLKGRAANATATN